MDALRPRPAGWHLHPAASKGYPYARNSRWAVLQKIPAASPQRRHDFNTADFTMQPGGRISERSMPLTASPAAQYQHGSRAGLVTAPCTDANAISPSKNPLRGSLMSGQRRPITGALARQSTSGARVLPKRLASWGRRSPGPSRASRMITTSIDFNMDLGGVMPHGCAPR